MPAHSCPSSTCPSSTSPASAANTGWTLITTPKKRGGTVRRTTRSQAYGTTELNSPAAAAYPNPAPVSEPATSSTITGMLSTAATSVAAAVACRPGSRAPTSRFSRMYDAQHPAASSPAEIPSQSLLPPGSTST